MGSLSQSALSSLNALKGDVMKCVGTAKTRSGVFRCFQFTPGPGRATARPPGAGPSRFKSRKPPRTRRAKLHTGHARKGGGRKRGGPKDGDRRRKRGGGKRRR